MKVAAIVALAGLVCTLGCSVDLGEPVGPGNRRDGGADGSMATGDGGRPAPGVRDVQAIVRDSSDPQLSPDSSCAAVTSDTERAPMNLLLVLDRSGSMADDDKWGAAVAAINSLMTSLAMTDPDARVGLLLFPALSDPSVEATYRTPVVPVGPVATTGPQIQTRLGNTAPGGGTPMACAMPGAIAYYQSAFTLDGTRNVVLITDGQPTDECSGVMCNPLDIANFLTCVMGARPLAKARVQAAVAGAGRADPAVRSYIVGTLEADAQFMSTLAINGNTQRAPGCETDRSCFYSLGSGTFEADLRRALDAIRGNAATCEFRLTDLDPNTFDPNLVNVNYTPTGGAARIVPRDPSHTNGWDYADGMRSIILSGPICDEVRANPGSVQILFGCPTVEPG